MVKLPSAVNLAMRDQDFLLSVIVPVYNEALLIQESVSRLTAAVSQLGCRYEILYVDDGSSDETFTLLQKERQKNPNLRLLKLTRNFGHQMAITAGMDSVKGDVVVTIDSDLQDPPELIAKMFEEWRKGFDIVYARRERRLGETIFKRWTAAIYYRLVRKMSGVNIPVDVGDFRLMSRRALDELNQLRERHRYVRGLVAWLGYKQTFVNYVRDKRYAGKTKYSLAKMLKFSLDGISSFSTAPLRLATYLGFAAASFSFLYIFYALYVRFITHDVVPGWTTVIIAVFFLGGVQLICLGIMGEYLGMLHEESKRRPLYIVEQTFG